MGSALTPDERDRPDRGGGPSGSTALDPRSPSASADSSMAVSDQSNAQETPRRRDRVRERLDLRLLRDRKVRRIALAHFTSAAGDGIILAALPFAIHASGGSDGQFVAAVAVQALTMALLLLPAGVIGDRFNRRRVAVVADLMRFGARATFALLLLLGDAAFWQLLVAQAVNGAGFALFENTMDGFVPEVFGDKDETKLQKINALRRLGLSLGLTIGPAIGGALYATTGTASTFAVDALTFLASAALIVRLPTPFARPTVDPASLRDLLSDVKEGWTAFWHIGWYWRVAIEFGIVNSLVFAPFFIIGPHVTEESFGGTAAWSAILVGVGAGEIVGSIIAIVLRPKRPLLLATTVVALWIVPLLFMASLAPAFLLVTSSLLAGISLAVFGAIWETTKQAHTPDHLRSRLASFDNFGSLALVPLGYVLGGVLLGTFGASLALVAIAAVLGMATLIVATDPTIRDLTRRPAQSEQPKPQPPFAGRPAHDSI